MSRQDFWDSFWDLAVFTIMLPIGVLYTAGWVATHFSLVKQIHRVTGNGWIVTMTAVWVSMWGDAVMREAIE